MQDWDLLWTWLLEHHIYNTAVLGFIIGFIINAVLKLKGVQKLLCKVKKIKAGAVEVEMKDGDSEKDIQQDGLLGDLKKELCEIKKRLDVHYGYIKEAAIKAGVSVVWSDVGAPFVEVINSGLQNANLGGNGNLRPRMVEVIMGLGKGGISIYRSLLNDFINKKKKNEEQLTPEFWETVKWIDNEIH